MAGCRCDLFDVGDALNDQAGQRIAAQPVQNVAAPAGRRYAAQLAGARAQNQARREAMMDAHRYNPPGHPFLLLFPSTAVTLSKMMHPAVAAAGCCTHTCSQQLICCLSKQLVQYGLQAADLDHVKLATL